MALLRPQARHFVTVCLFCSKDEFTVEGKDVGFVTAVEVKRDNSGFGSDWRLLYVRTYLSDF